LGRGERGKGRAEQASEVGVPIVPTMAKILSFCTSFCVASTARLGS